MKFKEGKRNNQLAKNKNVSKLRWDGKDWEKIDVKVYTTYIFIRKIAGHECLCFPVYYKGIWIAHLYCSGQVEFIKKERWKKGWEFKSLYSNEGNKFIYKRINK